MTSNVHPERPEERANDLTPKTVPLRTITLVRIGLLAWAVAFVVIMLTPSLREGGRHWWAWVPCAGFALGLLGEVYLRRGRGNAAGA